MAGHVRRRKSGSYQAIASYRDDTGRLVQLTRTVPTRREADDILPELLTQARKRSRPALPMDLNELLDLWWAIQGPKLSPSTRSVHGYLIDSHIRPRLGRLKLRVLTAYHIDRFYADLAATIGPHSIRNVHVILNKCLGQACKWKWITDNPAAEASPPPVPRTKKTLPTPAQFQRLLAEADKEARWFGVYLRLSVIAPGRRGELTALRWGDFEPATGTITFDEALAIGANGVVVKDTKTRASSRTMVIGAEMSKILTAYRDTLDIEALASPLTDDDYIFWTHYTRRPMNPATVSRIFQRVRDRAQVTIRLHDMRTVSSSWLQHGGISLPTVSHRLGHSRQSTTADIYTRRVTAEDVAAAEHISSLILGSPTPTDSEPDTGV